MNVDTIKQTHRHCAPDGTSGLEPISLVAKVTSANDRPAVKLSDNPAKVTGEPAKIARYFPPLREPRQVGG